MATLTLSVYGKGFQYQGADEPPYASVSVETNKIYQISAPQLETGAPGNPSIKYEIEVEANTKTIVVTTKNTFLSGKIYLQRNKFSGEFSYDSSGNLTSGLVSSIEYQWALNGSDINQSQRNSIKRIDLLNPIGWLTLNSAPLKSGVDYLQTIETGRFNDSIFTGIQDKEGWQFDPFGPSLLGQLSSDGSTTSSWNQDSFGNAFLVKGSSTLDKSNKIPESNFEVLVNVANKVIPLYYYVNASKAPVVDKFYGDALGPDAAEVTGVNELTVIFRTKGSAYVSGNYGWITISKFALDTGIEMAKYNFGMKKFDKVNPLDSRNNGPYFNDCNYDPTKPAYTCNYDLKQPSHPLSKPYIDALSTFSNVVNPKSYFLSTQFNGNSTQLINEGASLGVSLQTINVPQKTTLYWRLTGTNITASDLKGGKLTGSSAVGLDRKLSFSLNIAEDFKAEGDENLQISFFTDAAFKNQVTTASVTIKDTSTETLFASASTVLPAVYANLALTGSLDINGTGNSFNNTVTCPASTPLAVSRQPSWAS